jgi:hypothetical protein
MAIADPNPSAPSNNHRSRVMVPSLKWKVSKSNAVLDVKGETCKVNGILCG